MDRQELLESLAASPVRILMNDGNGYLVAHANEAIVSDDAAYILYRDEEDGKLRTMVLPLVSMAGVEPIAAEA